LEFKNWDDMSVTNTIFGRRELAVAVGVYIRNGSGTNIDAQTFKVRRLTILISIIRITIRFDDRLRPPIYQVHKSI